MIKKFRRGETTYTCATCKKLTRNTGGDERGCGLCLDCYDLAGINNGLTDNGEECFEAAYGKAAREILTRRPELADLFPEVRDAAGIDRYAGLKAGTIKPTSLTEECIAAGTEWFPAQPR